jgi:RimJ/RimL family protein N-acetyltransferase
MQQAGIALRGFVIREAERCEVAEIQAFNDSNPEYWLLTHGHPPPPDDAARAFDAHPPADMSYCEDLWFIVRDESGTIVAQIAVATDLMAAGVYHLGFFIVETQSWGRGLAPRCMGRISTGRSNAARAGCGSASWRRIVAHACSGNARVRGGSVSRRL